LKTWRSLRPPSRLESANDMKDFGIACGLSPHDPQTSASLETRNGRLRAQIKRILVSFSTKGDVFQ
jgi:hypothetical protein